MFLVMEPHLSSNKDIYFGIFMIGKRSFHWLNMDFFATSYGKGAVDRIGCTTKRSVWRTTWAGSTVPGDAASYAEFAAKINPNIDAA